METKVAAREGQEKVVIGLRTSKNVRDELKRRADAQDRSMNWMADRILRQGLGLKEAA